MAIWGFGVSDTAVSLLFLETLFMQISGVSLTLPQPLRLCLLRVLLGETTTATIFPLSKHTGGGDTAPAFSGLHVYLQFTWEVGLSPSPVEFSSHCHFYKLFHSWLLGLCCRSCLLWPAFLFIAHVGNGSFATCLFCCYCLLFSFFLFFPGWGQCFQGAMLIWPRVVCGSTMCH
jgi:hypothetical protein